jgi:hypothetical protein
MSLILSGNIFDLDSGDILITLEVSKIIISQVAEHKFPLIVSS